MTPFLLGTLTFYLFAFILQLRYQKCLDAHPSAGDQQQGAQEGKVND